MGKQGLTPHPTEKQQTPSSTRSRKDSKSPGGLKGNKKTHGQQGAVKGRRGRSGNNTAASKDTVTMAEAKADDEVKLEQPKIDVEERSEDERDAVCTCFVILDAMGAVVSAVMACKGTTWSSAQQSKLQLRTICETRAYCFNGRIHSKMHRTRMVIPRQLPKRLATNPQPT